MRSMTRVLRTEEPSLRVTVYELWTMETQTHKLA